MILPGGLFGMICFNALSPEQQEFLVIEGYLPWGWQPEGTVCDKPAAVEVFTKWDRTPGPRYYCLGCAIGYLLSYEQRIIAGDETDHVLHVVPEPPADHHLL